MKKAKCAACNKAFNDGDNIVGVTDGRSWHVGCLDSNLTPLPQWDAPTDLEKKMRARILWQRDHIENLRIAAANYMRKTPEGKSLPERAALSKAIEDATEALC